MRKLLYFLALGLILTTLSCNKAPVDDTPDPVAGPKASLFVARYIFATGETVSFINKSTNYNSSSWDFGDGTKSTLTNPVKTYTKAGSYIVKLTVKNSSGTVAVATTPVLVGTRTVSKLVITSIPAADTTGASWRTDFSGPDMTVKLIEVSTNTVLADWSTPVKVKNPASDSTTLTTGTPITIGNTLYSMEFYDNKSGSPTLMYKLYIDGKSKTAAAPSPFLVSVPVKNASGGSTGTYKIKFYYSLN
jgi:PKD repeat protein